MTHAFDSLPACSDDSWVVTSSSNELPMARNLMTNLSGQDESNVSWTSRRLCVRTDGSFHKSLKFRPSKNSQHGGARCRTRPMRLSNTERKYGTNRANKDKFNAEYKPTRYHRRSPHMWV